MVNTAIYPHLDASRKPAAFSRRIINGILRRQLGFKGVTVTDSLTAPAADRIPHTATRAMLAGSDLLIFGAESASERGYATLHTDAASPYGVLFASATASLGVRNVMATRTGPKISTCAIVDDGCTLVNSVGG